MRQVKTMSIQCVQKLMDLQVHCLSGDFKYVLLDEADYLSQNAQAILRNMMETYSSTCRFILTCNYPNKVIPAIHSRCQGYHIEKLDTNEFTARVAEILITEEVKPDLETLDIYVRSTYPDLRKVYQHGSTKHC